MKKNNFLERLQSFSNVSIQRRLTLFIFILLFLVISLLAFTSYFGIRRKSMEVGLERIKALTEQFGTLFKESSQKIKSSTKEAAQKKEILNYVLSPQDKFNISSLENLKEMFPRDTLTLAIKIFDKKKEKLFSGGKGSGFPLIKDTLFSEASAAPNFSSIGKLQIKNDSIIYPVVSSIRLKDEIKGYLVRWRLIASSKKSLDQLRGLLGGKAAIYVGNSDGSVWTNFVKIMERPPIKNLTTEIIEYQNSKDAEVIAAVQKIPGAPWVFLIELSKKEILEASNQFLQWLIIAALILFIFGFFISLIFSRNITDPLNRLTLATADIAKGNYSNLMKVDRADEIGKLGNSFNVMAAKVREYQSELENKVQSRTADLKEANKKLEKLNNKLTKLDEVKTNFFTNVSHELRTPLALILGPAEKLLSNNNLPETDQKLKLIQKNARVLLKHVNNLLDLSRLEAGKLKMNYINMDLSNIVKIVCSYFESLTAQKNINFNITAPEKLSAQADPEKIERILMNLLSNAFKYTPDHGTISCTLSQKENRAYFEIKDNGPGIDPKILESIFVRFQSSEQGLARNLGGVGLGLSIVKEFIEQHNGEIKPKNDEKGGAVFNFYIPLKAPAGAEVQEIIEVDSIFDNELNTELAKKTMETELASNERKGDFFISAEAPSVLIVEDNIEMNNFISEVLKEQYNIYAAYDGEEGLEKTILFKPDLIISDIMMPKMSGDQFIEKVISNPELSSIPIIILTSKADDKMKIDLLRKGVHDYLNKPFTIDELKARVENIINIKVAKDLLQNELKNKSENIASLINDLIQKKHFIESSLIERETLLKEIHHRIKNNLQIILSLLNLQSEKISDLKSLEAFNESQNRIRSMALIHEKLYKNNNFVKIDIKEYVLDLIKYLFKCYKVDSKKISLNTQVDDISIDMDLAISLGLIINETVSNSLKHAFKNKKDGEILILLKDENKNCCKLIVKDTGNGISKSEINTHSTFGLELIDALVNQIEGEMEITNDQGTEVIIKFPLSV